MTILLLILIVFFSAFQQTITGFGFALILMPIATLLLDLPTAAPLVALQGLTLYTVNLARYRRRVIIAEALPLVLTAALGVPVGVWLLVSVDASLVKSALGLILIAYSIYTMASPAGFFLQSKYWGALCGFLAGCLAGAYNTSGPVVVVYGTWRRWNKDEFRAILQTVFFLTGTLTVASHYIASHITDRVVTTYLLVVPALVLGVIAGAWVDPRVDKKRFRQLVTVMLLLLGVSLIVEALPR